jgi:hypothetical protein
MLHLRNSPAPPAEAIRAEWVAWLMSEAVQAKNRLPPPMPGLPPARKELNDRFLASHCLADLSLRPAGLSRNHLCQFPILMACRQTPTSCLPHLDCFLVKDLPLFDSLSTGLTVT